MEFRVLGPLEVLHAGKMLAVGAAKQRAVFALLILRAPEPISTERLIDELWGERPPASALHAVQVYVSSLRKALRPAVGAHVLASGSFGYRLAVEPEQIDARAFERLVAEAREALRAGAYEQAERLAGDGLALWRGPALADFTFADFATSEAARLEALRSDAIELCAEARLALGDAAHVIGGLEGLLAQEPLHEHTRALLMRALYQAGRQADALAVYREGYRVLHGELGLEPGQELREAEQSILSHINPSVGPGPTGSDPSAPVSLPIPASLAARSSAGYVGRELEHAVLRGYWDEATQGRRHCLLVAGEPGIGKTQFVAQAALELHAAGALALVGHCPEELSAPYGPWIQALTPFVERAPQAVLEHYVERYEGELGRLIPALRQRVPRAPAPRQTDPESERYLLFSALVGLLEHAAATAPVLLWLDDVHWADVTTLAILKHLVAEAPGARMLVIGTYREGEVTGSHPLAAVLADLRREERIDRVHLEGLRESDVEALVRDTPLAVRDERSRALVCAIAAETGGNPFFVREMIRHLSESATSGAPGAQPVERDRLSLPQSVQEVILRRVGRLGDACRRVLSIAAVIGPRFDFELLARVTSDAEDHLLDLLEAAVAASLLRECAEESGTFAFAHDLISHTLYGGLGPTRRGRIHHRIADALQELHRDSPEELARHWSGALPSDHLAASQYCRLAGEQALSKLAPDEAVRWFEQALEFREDIAGRDPVEACELRILVGEAQRQAGRGDYRATLLCAARQAEDIGDPEHMARAALANSRGFVSAFGVVDRERVAVLERAVELNRGPNPGLCARLLSLQAMELQFDPDHVRRRALADEALALARREGDARSLPYVLRDHFHATWSVDTLSNRRRTAEEMTALTISGDDPLARIWALDRRLQVAVESGALSEAAEVLGRLKRATEQLGQPGPLWHATYCAAGLAHLKGELEESERLAQAAVSLGERGGEPDTLFIYFGQLCMVRVEQGRGGKVMDALAGAVSQNPGVPAYEAAYAAVLCDLGRAAEASRLLERCLDRGFEDIPLNQIYSTALALWAKVAGDVGFARAADRLYALLEPWRDQVVWTGGMGYGTVESYLGILAATVGAHDRAREHFAAASHVHTREGMNGWQARNLCNWARSLRAAGAIEDGVAVAERALGLARGHGYGVSADGAAHLLHAFAVA